VDAPGCGAMRIRRGGSLLDHEDRSRSALRTEQAPTPPSPEEHVGSRVAPRVPAPNT